MKTLRMMTDEELVVLYAEGNNAAFDVLLNRYKSSIHSYIYFIVHNKDLTEDIFQETFVNSIISNFATARSKITSYAVRYCLM